MAWGYWSATSVQPDRRSPRRGTTVAQQLPVAAAPTPSLHQAQTAPQPQGSQVPQAPQGARACSSSSSSSAEGPLAAMAAAAAPSGAEPIRAARRPSLDLYGSHMDPLGSMSMPMERAGGLPLCSSAPHAHQMQGPQGVPHYRNVPWASTTAVHLDDGHDEELVINHSYCPRLDHRHPGQGHGPGPGHGHSHSHLHGLLAGPGQGMQGHGQGHGHGGAHGPGPGPGPGHGHHHHHHSHTPTRYQAQVQYHRADLDISDDEEEPGYASGKCCREEQVEAG